jgi:hypothetical protein
MSGWRGWRGSNPRPLASEANTLSTELQPHWRWYHAVSLLNARSDAALAEAYSISPSASPRKL